MGEMPDTAPVRPDEDFDREAVSRYLRQRVPELKGALTVEQFPGGHSNLTYLLRFGNRELVLRRPPLGPVAPTSHDMNREYRVLSVLSDAFPLAPRAFLICNDLDILGGPFYVMERRRGVVIRKTMPPELGEDPHTCGRISRALIDTLVALHAVDVAAVGLDGLGKPEGFVERQILGWTQRWERAKTREIPLMDHMAKWLYERIPVSQPPTLIHNDFKLDNVMFDPRNPERITGVLDWEMCTRGDPLVDLGLTLSYWVQADDNETRRQQLETPTILPGFWTRKELVQRYAERSGRDVHNIAFYEALAFFKTAVVVEQIYARYVRGQTRDERFADFRDRVPALAQVAEEVAERSGL